MSGYLRFDRHVTVLQSALPINGCVLLCQAKQDKAMQSNAKQYIIDSNTHVYEYPAAIVRRWAYLGEIFACLSSRGVLV